MKPSPISKDDVTDYLKTRRSLEADFMGKSYNHAKLHGTWQREPVWSPRFRWRSPGLLCFGMPSQFLNIS